MSTLRARENVRRKIGEFLPPAPVELTAVDPAPENEPANGWKILLLLLNYKESEYQKRKHSWGCEVRQGTRMEYREIICLAIQVYSAIRNSPWI
ncbi:hypothetical protein O6P43_023372 [Quillaja saponaria]|uniref:Uncharacterized protein n=1 Tax=Quillaja saponaria TaxID=32244 RepID=A0AAD7LF95_QUISA|nr:hypothetical protein O6P43_023372 [Quillaja saponaria]